MQNTDDKDRYFLALAYEYAKTHSPDPEHKMEQ